MRMRKKKHGDERIDACVDIIIKYDTDKRDVFDEGYFDRGNIHLEIGCGKGDFVLGMAKKYPDVNFIAVERVPNVIVTALEKVKNEGIQNVRFMIGDAAKICELVCEKIGEHVIERIYLNFSDPWPKKGYAKRRLTHRNFLCEYKRILKTDGSVFMKTDNVGLFDFSIEEFEAEGFTLRAVTRDLHHSEYSADNVMTEYERNFSSQGILINRLEAYLK